MFDQQLRSTRLKAHLDRTVEKETRKQPRSKGISSSCSALGNEVREEDRRDCKKGHDRVIDPK